MRLGIWLDPWKVRSREIQHRMEVMEVLLIICTKIGKSILAFKHRKRAGAIWG